jgi:hypothetical protein
MDLLAVLMGIYVTAFVRRIRVIENLSRDTRFPAQLTVQRLTVPILTSQRYAARETYTANFQAAVH